LPCRCESSSDSERAVDGGRGGLRLPEICIKVQIIPFNILTLVTGKIIRNFFQKNKMIICRLT
jgi:hypothetical protein